MRKNKNIINLLSLSIIILLFLSSCNNSNFFKFVGKDSSYDCILNSGLSYNQILSKEDLRNVLSIKTENVIEESNGYPSKHNHGYCYYTWSSIRPDKKSELSEHILLPDNNYVRIENFKRYDIKLGQEKIIKAFYEDDHKMSDTNLSSSDFQKNDPLKNIDLPYLWELSPSGGGRLIFLNKNEKLEIGIKISDEFDENFKAAEEFVQIIINKCK